ncbi:hypothetical protein B0E38_05414 [Streptomyces sp. 111WW2]|nr:hypothetical protein B0E38_05414 [Streptomyces sp. 111WW2]
MCEEWKACDTGSRFVRTPLARQAAVTSSTTSSSPEITNDSGPLTPAMPTASPYGAIEAYTSSSEACTAAIAPPSRAACISRPRSATRQQASSRSSTPERYAAVTSPMEWPRR